MNTASSTALRLYWITLLLVVGPISFSQSYILLDSLAVEGTHLTVDKLENVYTWNDKGKLIKYGGPTSVQFYFDDFTLGAISHVDVSDPLSPLVFYDDYMVIRILDRTLNQKTVINLNSHGFFEVHCVALSGDKHIWVYDDASNRLSKIGTNGSVLTQSQDMRLLANRVVRGTTLIEQQNTIYLFEKGEGVHLFDIFGNYKRFIPLKQWAKDLIIPPSGILIGPGPDCSLYNMNSFLESDFALPSGIHCNDPFVFRNQKLFVLDAGTVRIYRWER